MDTSELNRLNVIVVDCDKDFETDIQYQNQVVQQVVNEINTIRQNKLENVQSICSIKNKNFVEKELSSVPNKLISDVNYEI
jgi:hypothetical protein